MKIRAQRSSNPWCQLTSALDFHAERSSKSVPAFPITEGPARPLLSITMHAAGACPNVSNYVVNLRAWASAPHAQLDTASSASTLPDSRTGCVGLAANGAGPRRCTAGVTPASVRTRDRRTEARTDCPGPLCPAVADHIRASQVSLDDSKLATHEKTRWPAVGGSPKEGVTGH